MFVFAGTIFTACPAAADPDPVVTREDLVQAFGQPEAVMQRGNRQIVSFPSGVRVEIEEGKVVMVRGARDATVVGTDGVRYAVDRDGKLVPIEEDADIAALLSGVGEPSPEPGGAPLDEPTASEEGASSIEEEVPVKTPPEVYPQEEDDELAQRVEDFLENYGALDEPEPVPAWVEAVSVVVSLAVRFALVVLLLRIALGWMGIPFLYRDLVKISIMYTAIRDGLHGLGDLGDYWRLIRIFRLDEIGGFIALAYFIYRFGVARTGLTALQIAVATKVAAYVLMVLVGIVLSITLLSIG